jgi:putative membrane protein
MMWGNYGSMGWGWVFGALVLIGLVVLTVLLVRLFSSPRSVPPQPTAPSASGGQSSPKQILDERYAKGELTTEEYRERLSALGLGS